VYGTFYDVSSSSTSAEFNLGSGYGPIGAPKILTTDGVNSVIQLRDGNGTIFVNRSSNPAFQRDWTVTRVVRADGAPDTGGDLPNPNPTPSIAIDGVADSAAPNLLAGANPIITGTPLADDGSGGLATGADSDFTSASALAPLEIAGAIAAIAAGLSKLAKFLQDLKYLLDLLKKLTSKTNKSSFYYNYGNLSGDGFIRILSEPPDASITPLYVDLQFTEVNPSLGKVLGNDSPNYYAFESLGNIRFVSSTFGVLSVTEVRHVRTSIQIPSLAYGFFYHFGLNGTNKANASGFYLKQEDS
jgi:hypothetical protein